MPWGLPAFLSLQRLVIDDGQSSALEVGQSVEHGLKLFGRMSDPVRDLVHDAHRFAATKGLRRISGEFLVGHVRVVLDHALRLDDVDPTSAFTLGHLGPPH